jgi:hypothetical protein
MNGETLYKLYRSKLMEGNHLWGLNVVSATTEMAAPGPLPCQWDDLPERVKTFWNQLAQEYDHACH